MEAIAFWNPEKLSKYSFSSVKIKGFVLFTQLENSVKVNIYIEGLSDGNHGIHIHEKGLSEVNNFEDIDCCEKLGGHFNVEEKWSLTHPNGTKHGEHTGDLCLNILSKDNIVTHTFFDEKISLHEDDDRSIIGRSVVIHKDEDDVGKGLYLEEEKNVQILVSGNAGERIACAEIRLTK